MIERARWMVQRNHDILHEEDFVLRGLWIVVFSYLRTSLGRQSIVKTKQLLLDVPV